MVVHLASGESLELFTGLATEMLKDNSFKLRLRDLGGLNIWPLHLLGTGGMEQLFVHFLCRPLS